MPRCDPLIGDILKTRMCQNDCVVARKGLHRHLLLANLNDWELDGWLVQDVGVSSSYMVHDDSANQLLLIGKQASRV